MARKRRWKKEGKVYNNPGDADPTTRSISVFENLVAVSAGKRWRVAEIGLHARPLHDDTTHEGAVRGLTFSSNGDRLLTCGDDKTARVWTTDGWRQLLVLKVPKKATACALATDGRHAFVADRFGDVSVALAPDACANSASTCDVDSSHQPVPQQPGLLLGHLQSILTSLTPVHSEALGLRLLVSTDRDCKIRVSILPEDPCKGSVEIQSYCLGHTNFVTCSAAVPTTAAAAAGVGGAHCCLLLSGGGDGSVRLWNAIDGKQLACYVASTQPPQESPGNALDKDEQLAATDHNDTGSGEGNGGDDDDVGRCVDGDGDDAASASDDDGCGGSDGGGGAGAHAGGSRQYRHTDRERERCAAVLSVAVSPDASCVAVAVEGQQSVQLLRMDPGNLSLSLEQELTIDDVSNPSALAFDNAGRLWVVGGVLALETRSAHVGVAAQSGDSGEWQDVTATVLPEPVRVFLEGREEEEEAAAAAETAAGRAPGYYHEGFKRKLYLKDKDPEFMSLRNSERETKRLHELWSKEDAAQAASGVAEAAN